MSVNPVTTKKLVARTILILLAFLLGINPFGLGLHGLKVSATASPDLIVQDVTLSPVNPVIDDTVTITVAIKNQGAGAAGLFHIACYLDSTILDTKTVSSLGAGITTTVAFTWTAEKGSHVVKAIADSSDTIAETDETNNIKTFNFSTMAPDLIIQSISWSPQSPAKGDSVVFSVIVKNQGNIKSRATDVTLYVDGVSRGTRDVDALNPGFTLTRTFDWGAIPGSHVIRAVVDQNDYVHESDETNNELSITLSTTPPDLVIPSITWTPQSPSRNEIVTFTVTVKNQGSGRSDACQLGYYIDNIFVKSIPVSALEAGASCNVTFTWTALPDTHSFKMDIDYLNTIAESDEANNECTTIITTVVPDLTVKDITWLPLDAGVGDNITFTVVVKNLGTGNAPASNAAYYIGGVYQGYLSFPALSSGAEASQTFSIIAQYDSITVMVAVDYDNKITESNEANNMMTKSFPIVQPDLLISNINWMPVNPVVGDTVVFTITVKNQGGGKASNYNVGYYMDDILMGSDPVYATNAGASVNMTFEWQAQNGTHVFKAVADYNRHLTESNENNNELSVTVLPFMPDLIIGTVTWTPIDMPAGTEVTFNIDIQNLGTLSAGASRVSYYVDGAAAGYDYIESVDAGATVTEHFNWIATSGPHTLTIVADANNQVLEMDETNNTKVVSIPPPDLVVQDITYTPLDASPGGAVVITATIKNQGSSKTQDSLVTLYIDGNLISSQDLPPIDAGASFSRSFNWVAEARTHTFKVTADIDNTVIESDETNNDKEIQFSAMTPDLTVQNFSWQANDPQNSNAVNFTITVNNIGTGAAGEYKVQYSFDDGPAVIKDMPSLPSGETAEFTFTSILSAGSHTVRVIADPGNDIVELDEENNETDYAFSTIAPDLVVRTITWEPLDAGIGDKVTITAVVANQGVAEAINPRIALFIDGVDSGYVYVPQIDTDATANVTFSWTALAGQHEISVLANSDNLVQESNMSNNNKSRSISFEKPDAPVKKTAGVGAVPSVGKGFLNTWWWLLLLIAGVLGIAVFVSALRATKKKY